MASFFNHCWWRDRARRFALATIVAACVGGAFAHPGASIAVAGDGRVYFVDTGGGLFAISPAGRLERQPGSAFHWFALDDARRFAATRWPSIPGAEITTAGSLILSSDFPVVVGGDGGFYFVEASGDRARLVRMTPAGTRTVRAALPMIRRDAETITWINGLAAGPGGSVYYAVDASIQKVSAAGVVSVVAANVRIPNCGGVPGIGPELGPYLRGLSVDSDGTVYVAAAGCRAVLKITPQGSVTPILRSSGAWAPTAVAVHQGDVYVLEYTHTASDDRREWLPRVRRVSRNGTVATLAAIARR